MTKQDNTQHTTRPVIEEPPEDERYRWRRGQSVLTLNDAARWFLSEQQAQKLSHNSIKTYRNGINVIGSIIGTLNEQQPNQLGLDVINRNDLADAFSEYSATHSISSQRQTRSVWNNLCRFLTAEEVIDKNPMDRIPAISGRRGRTIPKALPPEAVESLLSYLADPNADGGHLRKVRKRWRERDYALILLFLVTGMRESEMRGVNLGDIVEPYGYNGARNINVRGKGDKERLLSIEAPAVKVLEDYLETRYLRLPHTGRPAKTPWGHWEMDDPLFVSADGERMTTNQIYYRVEVAYREAGINGYRARGALVHQLRHTLATNLADDPEVTLFQLRQFLGHSSLSSTERYTAGAGRATRDAARRNPVYRVVGGEYTGR